MSKTVKITFAADGVQSIISAVKNLDASLQKINATILSIGSFGGSDLAKHVDAAAKRFHGFNEECVRANNQIAAVTSSLQKNAVSQNNATKAQSDARKEQIRENNIVLQQLRLERKLKKEAELEALDAQDIADKKEAQRRRRLKQNESDALAAQKNAAAKKKIEEASLLSSMKVETQQQSLLMQSERETLKLESQKQSLSRQSERDAAIAQLNADKVERSRIQTEETKARQAKRIEKDAEKAKKEAAKIKTTESLITDAANRIKGRLQAIFTSFFTTLGTSTARFLTGTATTLYFDQLKSGFNDLIGIINDTTQASEYLTFGGLVRGSIEIAKTTKELQKLSKQIGMSVSDSMELSSAMGMAGVDTEFLGTRLSYMGKQIAKAEDREAPYVEMVLQKMGLQAGQLRLKGTRGAFDEIVAGFDKLTTEAEKAGAAMILFERAGSELLPFIKDSNKYLDQAQQILGELPEMLNRNSASFMRLTNYLEAFTIKRQQFFTAFLEEFAEPINKFLDSILKTDFADFGKEIASYFSNTQIALWLKRPIGDVLTTVFSDVLHYTEKNLIRIISAINGAISNNGDIANSLAVQFVRAFENVSQEIISLLVTIAWKSFTNVWSLIKNHAMRAIVSSGITVALARALYKVNSAVAADLSIKLAGAARVFGLSLSGTLTTIASKAIIGIGSGIVGGIAGIAIPIIADIIYGFFTKSRNERLNEDNRIQLDGIDKFDQTVFKFEQAVNRFGDFEEIREAREKLQNASKEVSELIEGNNASELTGLKKFFDDIPSILDEIKQGAGTQANKPLIDEIKQGRELAEQETSRQLLSGKNINYRLGDKIIEKIWNLADKTEAYINAASLQPFGDSSQVVSLENQIQSSVFEALQKGVANILAGQKNGLYNIELETLSNSLKSLFAKQDKQDLASLIGVQNALLKLQEIFETYKNSVFLPVNASDVEKQEQRLTFSKQELEIAETLEKVAEAIYKTNNNLENRDKYNKQFVANLKAQNDLAKENYQAMIASVQEQRMLNARTMADLQNAFDIQQLSGFADKVQELTKELILNTTRLSGLQLELQRYGEYSKLNDKDKDAYLALEREINKLIAQNKKIENIDIPLSAIQSELDRITLRGENEVYKRETALEDTKYKYETGAARVDWGKVLDAEIKVYESRIDLLNRRLLLLTAHLDERNRIYQADKTEENLNAVLSAEKTLNEVKRELNNVHRDLTDTRKNGRFTRFGGSNPIQASVEWQNKYADGFQGLFDLFDQLGSKIDELANSFSSSMSDALYDVAIGAKDVGDALGNMWNAWGQAALRAITDSVAEFVMSKTVMLGAEKAFAAAQLALNASTNKSMQAQDAAAATEEQTMWSIPAILKSIASGGAAVLIGLAAMAAITAIAGGFASGGRVKGKKQLAWLNDDAQQRSEYVVSGASPIENEPFLDWANAGNKISDLMPATELVKSSKSSLLSSRKYTANQRAENGGNVNIGFLNTNRALHGFMQSEGIKQVYDFGRRRKVFTN